MPKKAFKVRITPEEFARSLELCRQLRSEGRSEDQDAIREGLGEIFGRETLDLILALGRSSPRRTLVMVSGKVSKPRLSFHLDA